MHEMQHLKQHNNNNLERIESLERKLSTALAKANKEDYS